MMKLASAIVAVALCLAAPSARADENEAKAKALYKSGVAHYEKGEYKAAIRDLRAADDLVHSPALAYNIAQAYRLLNDCRDALAWYRTYLDRDPLAPNKDKVNEQIGNMLKCLPKKEEPVVATPAPPEPAPEAKPEPTPSTIPTTAAEPPPRVATTEPPPRPAEPAPPPPAPPPPAPVASPPPDTSSVLSPPPEPASVDPGHGKRVTGLVLAGAGVAVTAVGVVFALQAKNAADDVSALSASGGTWSTSFADKESSGQRDQIIGTLGIGLGVAAIVGGGVLYYLGTTERAEHAAVSVGVAPGGANVVMSWRY
jgi:tetratricopeptide (TPR) repeat protein